MQLGRKTVLQSIVENEKDTWIKDTLESLNLIDDEFKDGNHLYEVQSNGQAINDLLSANSIIQNNLTADNRVPKYHDSHRYVNILSNSIIKVDKPLQYAEAVQTIYELSTMLGSNFAGAVLIDVKGNLYNPLHTLTSLVVLDREDVLNQQYTLAIYTYDDKRKELDEEFNSNLADPTKIKENISNLIKTITFKAKKRYTDIIKQEINDDKDRIDLEYRVSKVAGEVDDSEYYISTHQVLTRGVFVPYYGTSLIKLNGSTQGMHLSPMLSANISADIHRPLLDNTPEENSVCTGSLNNKTIEGLRTLTHSNLSSPYNHYTLADGFLVYIDAMIEKSFEIYKAAKLIKE